MNMDPESRAESRSESTASEAAAIAEADRRVILQDEEMTRKDKRTTSKQHYA